MNKELPKYHETYSQILEVLHSGDEISKKDVVKQVQDSYYSDLPEDLLSIRVSTGERKILHRIYWGIVYLGLGKFVESTKRGFTKITDKGKRAHHKGGLTRQELKDDPDYQKYQEERVARGKSAGAVIDTADTGDTPQELIDTNISELKDKTKDELLEKLKEVDPDDFEKIVLDLLKKMRYGELIEKTRKSRDGGIDGIINEDTLGLSKIYIQAKRFANNAVGELDIRNFIGAMSSDTAKGIFVTTSKFNNNAKQKARDAHHHAIRLIDGDELVELMYQNDLGVQIKHTYEIKEVDSDSF